MMLGMCPATPLTQLPILQRLLPTLNLLGTLDIRIGSTRLRTMSLTLTWTAIVTLFLRTNRWPHKKWRSLKASQRATAVNQESSRGS
jgi:hypothetical protein